MTVRVVVADLLRVAAVGEVDHRRAGRDRRVAPAHGAPAPPPPPGRRPHEWSRIEIHLSASISVRRPSTSTQPDATPTWWYRSTLWVTR